MNNNFENREYTDDLSNKNNQSSDGDLDKDNLLKELSKVSQSLSSNNETPNNEKAFQHSNDHSSQTNDHEEHEKVKNNTKVSQREDNPKFAKLPAIFHSLPLLLKEMKVSGINFHIDQDGHVVIKDFYRPATITMIMNNDGDFSIELRRNVYQITSIDDLIEIHYDEWKRTGKTKGNYAEISKGWADLLAEKELIGRKLVFFPND